jgi:hypothetical protein
MLAATLNGSIEPLYGLVRLQNHQNRGFEKIGGAKISPGFNPVGATDDGKHRPIQHAGRLGAEKQDAFPPTSQNHSNGELFFDLRSPFCYTWSGVAYFQPMGAFLNAILWGCARYPKLLKLSV